MLRRKPVTILCIGSAHQHLEEEHRAALREQYARKRELTMRTFQAISAQPLLEEVRVLQPTAVVVDWEDAQLVALLLADQAHCSIGCWQVRDTGEGCVLEQLELSPTETLVQPTR